MTGGTKNTPGIPVNGELLTTEQYEAEQAVEQAENQEIQALPHWQEQLEELAENPNRPLRVPRNKEFSRAAVVNSFVNAFELIGGVPRLALWADKNPTKFYQLYSRLLPSQASSALGESNEMVIKHVLPKGPLDE